MWVRHTIDDCNSFYAITFGTCLPLTGMRLLGVDISLLCSISYAYFFVDRFVILKYKSYSDHAEPITDGNADSTTQFWHRISGTLFAAYRQLMLLPMTEPFCFNCPRRY